MDNPKAWFNFGAAQAALGHGKDAEHAYRKAIELDPRYAEAWSNLGGLLGKTVGPEEAVRCYRKAIECNPALAPLWSNLANALCDINHYHDAEVAARKALELAPQLALGWINLSRALYEIGRLPEARSASERATELLPGAPQAWASLANAQLALRDFDGAIASYRKAIALQPQNAAYHANLGVILRTMGEDTAALTQLRHALELDPANGFAAFNLATSLLEAGAFMEGWQLYEARWKQGGASPPPFKAKGKFNRSGRLLLWAEQGVGDQILFAPLAAEAAKAGADVTLEVDSRLAALFRRSFPDVRIVGRAVPPIVQEASFDTVLPLGSLTGSLRPSWESFPRHNGYLRSDVAKSAHYRRSLEQPAAALTVGISWRSFNPENGEDKTAPLSEWGEVLSVPNTRFVCLQYGDVAAESSAAAERFGTNIIHLPQVDLKDDLDGLASLIMACDIVITISGVVAHLCGALGHSGWVLLPRRVSRLWYWRHHREDSPWYPSLKLFSQAQHGDWSGVMRVVRERLHRMLASRR
jgi:tetratricopeptide (TPR) repeat protein